MERDLRSDLIPVETIRAIEAYYPETGPHWLAQLPDLIHQCVDRWDLELEPAFVAGEASWKAPVRLRDGTEAVLKIAVPSPVHQAEATEALRAWDGRGAVRLLEADDAIRASLLERCRPGHDAFGLSVSDGVRVATDLLPQLWIQSLDVSFPALADRATSRADTMVRRLTHPDAPVEVGCLDAAATLLRELPGASTDWPLLHGDFALTNVLSSERGWLAVDPSPVVGDPAWEVASFLAHRRDFLDMGPTIDAMAATLGLDRLRIRAWMFTDIVHGLGWFFAEGHLAGASEHLAALDLFRPGGPLHIDG